MSSVKLLTDLLGFDTAIEILFSLMKYSIFILLTVTFCIFVSVNPTSTGVFSKQLLPGGGTIILPPKISCISYMSAY